MEQLTESERRIVNAIVEILAMTDGVEDIEIEDLV
jgi:hypothetical protein